MRTYLRLLKYVKPYTWVLFLGFLFALFISSVNVMIIPIVGKLSQSIGAKDMSQLNLNIAIIITLYFLKNAFSFAHRYFVSIADQGITRDMRLEMFEHLQNLSLDFYSKTRTGEIITLIMNDIILMEDVIVSTFTSLLPSIMTIIGITGYLLKLDWKLSMVSLIMLPVITIVSARFVHAIRDVAARTREKVSDITSVLHEVVTGAKIVKSFTMEDEEIKKFAKVSDLARQIALRSSAIRSIQVPLFGFIQAVAAVIVIWFGGFEIASGDISPSNLIAFFSGVLMLGDPMGDISGMNITIQMGLVSAKRFFGILDTMPTVMEAKNAVEMKSMNGEVAFKKVSFKYESNENTILKDINISCRAGEVIAIVGRSGAGKSTLVGLIPRFYDPLEGQLIVDGRDVKEYKIRSFRKFIGIVPQETLLFSGTIKENIAYGRMNASDKEIEEVAKMANAHDFIKAFPGKYNTMIGEKGVRLSGGERQRIAIARAFLRDPKILILDEATSSLDSHSEHYVQEALEKLMKGRTTFVIAHRLSTVRFADRIIVLKDGSIIEAGSHDELLAKEGEYKKLYDMQLGRFAKTGPKVFGFLEMKRMKITYGGINIIRGWILVDDNTQVTKVRLLCDSKEIALGGIGISRPGVSKHFPNFANSLHSGFEIEFTTSEDPTKDYVFEAYDDGRKIASREFKLSEFDDKAAIHIGANNINNI
jgi:subfamily B ATP-binding cassette protein MsbA